MADPFSINPTDEVGSREGSGTAVGAPATGEGGVICSFCGKMKRTGRPANEEIDAHECCKCESLPSLGMELLAITDAPTAVVVGEGGVICALCRKMKRTLPPEFEETHVHEYCECERPSSSRRELREITDATTAAAGEGGLICASCGKMKRTVRPEIEETAAHVKEDQFCDCESPSASGSQSLSTTAASEESSGGENIPELDLDDLVKNFGVPEGFLLKGLVPEAYNHPPSEEAAEECSICTEKVQNGDVLGRMLCTHKFHYDCIKRWLMEKNFCPNCKKIAIELWNLQ